MDADEYRRIAADCISPAKEAKSAEFRLKLIDMAQTWLKLADQAERNSQADLVYARPGDKDEQRPMQ